MYALKKTKKVIPS